MKPGDASNYVCTVTDFTGALVASSVTAEIRQPDKSILSLVVANPSLGVFTSQFLYAQVGIHTVRFTGTGTYPFVSELQVLVAPLDF